MQLWRLDTQAAAQLDTGFLYSYATGEWGEDVIDLPAGLEN